jgi:hypothetical protein
MYCHGSLEARLDFLAACPHLTGKSLARAQAANAYAKAPSLPFDTHAAWAEFSQLTGLDRDIIYSISPDPTAKAWA